MPAKLRALDRLWDAYSADMSKDLSQLTATEFAVVEKLLARTAGILEEHTRRLLDRAARDDDEA